MRRNSSASFFPPIKVSSDTWLLDSRQRADTFAAAFSSKFHLPPEEQEIFFAAAVRCMSEVCVIRTRHIRRESLTLREHEATGPDAIPIIFLRMLAHEIAFLTSGHDLPQDL